MNGDTRRIIILVVVAVVGIACLCVCCVALGVGAELYSRRLMATTPTSHMQSPGPPRVPDRTPGAVATAPPAPGMVAGASLLPEEQAHVAGFDDQSQRWADSRQTFDTLMAVPNPADAGWKNEVAAQFSA